MATMKRVPTMMPPILRKMMLRPPPPRKTLQTVAMRTRGRRMGTPRTPETPHSIAPLIDPGEPIPALTGLAANGPRR